MAKKHKGLMSNIKSKASKVVKEVKEEMNPKERLVHAWKGALADGGKLHKTNAAFPMGKGSQGIELFREMMIERGRIPGDPLEVIIQHLRNYGINITVLLMILNFK